MTVTAAGLSRRLWTCVAADTKPTDSRVLQNDVLLVTDTSAYFVANIISNVVTWVASPVKPPQRGAR
jgi:hypothetical protein